MTAIAAVLAFAHPAMAQEVTPTPVTPTPLTVTPVPVAPPVSTIAPDVEATPAASDPLSPVATPETATVSAEKVQPRATNKRPPRTVSRAAPAARRASAPPPASATRAATPPPVAATPPVETAPLIPTATVAPLATSIEPPATAAPPAPAELSNDNSLEIAGAAGLGLLALLGIGAAFRRRSRRAEDEVAAFEQPIEAPLAPAAFAEPMREPAIRREPAVVAATAPAAVGKPIAAPAASLPEGFDLSRFGAHVQAAYRGPTEDNPSLSLKHRLRRASAMDQMARRDGTDQAPANTVTAPTDSGAVVSRMRPAATSERFMLAKGAVRPTARPVTQH